jgi:hypothetical protein
MIKKEMPSDAFAHQAAIEIGENRQDCFDITKLDQIT